MPTIITSIILFVISALLAECSIRHFLERGYLFNNAYIYAPKTERESMDKKPYYRQSAVVFLLMSAVFIVLGLAVIFESTKLELIEIPLIAGAVIYAVISAVKIEKCQNDTGNKEKTIRQKKRQH